MADDKGTRRIVIIAIIVLIIVLIAILILIFIYKPGAPSSTSSTTSCQNVSPPAGVIAINTELTKIRTFWVPTPSAKTYRVYIGTISGFNRTTALNSFLTRDAEYVIENLVLGRTYFIKVESIGICGNISELSDEVSVTLGFPAKFRIVSRADPNLALTVAPDFNNVVVDTFCSGEPGDDLCIWSYDSNNNFIITTETPTNCMKTYPQSVDIRIKYESCALNSYYNAIEARQWNYDGGPGTLCNPLNPEGLNCVGIGGPPTAGQSTIRQPYDGTDFMGWDLVEV